MAASPTRLARPWTGKASLSGPATTARSPILRRYGLEAAVRPSLAVYNTFGEVDTLVRALRDIAWNADAEGRTGSPARRPTAGVSWAHACDSGRGRHAWMRLTCGWLRTMGPNSSGPGT